MGTYSFSGVAIKKKKEKVLNFELEDRRGPKNWDILTPARRGLKTEIY